MALKPGFSALAYLSVCVLVAIGLARQILPSQRVSEAVLDSERLFVHRGRVLFGIRDRTYGEENPPLPQTEVRKHSLLPSF